LQRTERTSIVDLSAYPTLPIFKLATL